MTIYPHKKIRFNPRGVTAALVFALCAVSVCFAQGEKTVPPQDTSIRIKLLWRPQAQFAGFYMAQADGLYEKAGVKVILNHAQQGEDVLDSLKEGKTNISVAWPVSAMQRAARGEDVVNIGQLTQSSALMLIARKESGIVKPEDIAGHRVGLWIAPSLKRPFEAFFRHYKITDYTEAPVLARVDMFLYKGVDVISCMEYNEFFQIYCAGIDEEDLVCFYLNDTFSGWVDDGLYCKSSFYKLNPAACRAITAATLEGWRRAFGNPRRALEIIKSRCSENDEPFDFAHQRQMLVHMKNIVFPQGANNSGVMSEDSFKQIQDTLKPEANELKYNQFVPGNNTEADNVK